MQQEINNLKAQIDSLRRPVGIGSETASHPSRATMLPGDLLKALNQDSNSGWSLVSSGSKQSRASFDPLMGSWWTRNEPPPSGLITILAKMFAEKEHHYTHDPRPPEFYESLYNPDPNTGLHPALRNAVFLLACGYYQGPFAQLEPLFLQRTKYHLGQSLALADRLLDYVEAYILFTIYHGLKGRYFQGIRNIAAAVAFAFACGLHALRPPEWRPADSSSLLPRTLCRSEIRHRIRVWWIVFSLNRLGNAAYDINSDFDDNKVETVWELPLESNNFEEQHQHTVSSLFVRDTGATYVYHDTANAIRSKCAALIDRAARMGSAAPHTSEGDHRFWKKFEILDQAIRNVADSLPSAFEEPRYEAAARCVTIETENVNRITIVPHIFACHARILLHWELARAGSLKSHTACLEASWKAVPLVRKTVEQDIGHVSPLLLSSWARMFRVFTCEHSRLVIAGDTERAQFIILELRVLSRALKEQAKYNAFASEFFCAIQPHHGKSPISEADVTPFISISLKFPT
ncbi:hypothetical protein BOTBODRAFT_477223 [Botryobasidium botryosum FD-172 SS1]|uniref:Xylanolytic transcriptional activator regulatory domain-containing protein n=1 Tax=Botryobasidium botryosum (strain FD-172 SS1) TaxID=930990 RepID=A0A067N418_BOTB1|nr:hypothetical protein BOTBODRAFT_477223 [Botryobasidium botryosum FD-172 SS1]